MKVAEVTVTAYKCLQEKRSLGYYNLALIGFSKTVRARK